MATERTKKEITALVAALNSMPKTCLISPHLWTVEQHAEAPVVNGKEEDYWAWADHRTHKIEFWQCPHYASTTMLAETAWHEILHALWRACGISTPPWDNYAPLKTVSEEDIVSKLAVGMTRFYQDNPEWTRWFQRWLKKER